MPQFAQAPEEVSTSKVSPALGVLGAVLMGTGVGYLGTKRIFDVDISRNEATVFGSEILLGAGIAVLAIVWDALTRRRIG